MNQNLMDNYNKKVNDWLEEQLELNGVLVTEVPVEIASVFADEAIIETAYHYEVLGRYN